METTLTSQLERIVGTEDVAVSSLERKLYSHDAAPIPGVLSLFFKTLPDLIVRPDSAGEVAEVLRIASEHKSPVVPRAAGSWSLGGVTPVKGGIVLDVGKLKKIGDVSSDGSSVEVDAGVVWKDLMRRLDEKGSAVLSYPTSAPSSTVGGWVSTGGYGVGSLRHGHVADQIEALEVVTAQGEVLSVARDSVDPKMEWFVGTEGQFGVITKVRLRVRKKPAASIVRGVYVSGRDDLTELVRDFAKLGTPLYALKVLDSGLVTLRSMLTSGHKEDRSLVLLVIEGSAEEVSGAASAFEKIVAQKGLEPCADELAEAEWQERYWPMRIGRLGPTVLGAETVIPVDRLTSVLREMVLLGAKHDAQIGIEAHVISEDSVLVLVMYLADERKSLKYVTRLSLVREIVKIGLSHGGQPYGIGLWNSVYARRSLGKEYYTELRRLKARFDPQGIMNPGKFFRAETRFGIPITRAPYAVVMNALNVARRLQ
ncbi:MAG: FAD-binding oxidoreductase [Actinobacteria bacterium]|nr:FAD-binding oxidoreductase [Actinomycetota bacterium]